jgi:hypothetical protein
MKIRTFILASILPLIVIGCAGTRPPSKTEQTFFTVTTNFYPVVVPVTNLLVITNEAGTKWETNIVYKTNFVEGYNFEANTNAAAVVETGTAIGNFFGVGGIAGTILAALFGIYAKMRSNTAFKTAGLLAQVIEAGRKILATTPQGQKLETEWVAWMSKQQTEAGVILEVAKLLKTVVNNESAQLVADQLIEMARKAQPKS